jgi:hypothetical protein
MILGHFNPLKTFRFAESLFSYMLYIFFDRFGHDLGKRIRGFVVLNHYGEFFSESGNKTFFCTTKCIELVLGTFEFHSQAIYTRRCRGIVLCYLLVVQMVSSTSRASPLLREREVEL